MKRFPVMAAVFAFVTLVTPAPLVLAQDPAPKVTISGLFDQVTAAGRNFYDANFSRDGDREWYARTRFRPDFEFAVAGPRPCWASRSISVTARWGRTTAGSPATTAGAWEAQLEVARPTPPDVSTSIPTSPG